MKEYQQLDSPASPAIRGTEWTREILDKMFQDLNAQGEDHERKGSGWRLVYIKHLIIQLTPPPAANAGGSYIPTPESIVGKKAVVNIKNDDEECFRWCILAHLHPVDKNPNRVSNYVEYKDELVFKNLSFPIVLIDIDKFERYNREISVYVFALEDVAKGISTPIRSPRPGDEERKHQVHLLLLSNADYTKNHYVLVNSVSSLIGATNKHTSYVCLFCFSVFTRASGLENHKTFGCNRHHCAKVQMPESDQLELKFKPVMSVSYKSKACSLSRLQPWTKVNVDRSKMQVSLV